MSDAAKKAALSKLSPEVREAVLANPGLALLELQQRRKHFPSKDFIPNVGQMRLFDAFRQMHEEFKDYPHTTIFRSGNGVGKTCSLAIMLVGVCLGAEFLDAKWLNLGFFHDFKKLRKKRGLRIRLVADGADMGEQGSLYQQIVKWMPMAKFEGKQGDYYTRVRVPSVEEGYNETVIDFKSHNQSGTAHAGPDFDLIMFNEPPPQLIYTENTSRTRMGGITGKSGYVMMFLTPLFMAGYLHKIEMEDHEPGEIHVVEGSIWDNCADHPGTRGTLSEKKINEMIRGWKTSNPLEVPARENGKYMFLAGAIFQGYNRTVHLIDPIPIDPSWNIYHIVDPHDSKPPFAIWVALDPMNRAYVIAEYPNVPWDEVNGTNGTIKHFIMDFDMIERGVNSQFPYMRNLRVSEENRIGDPNRMKCRTANQGHTIKQDYEEVLGWSYNVNVPDDVLSRNNKVREFLFYDHTQPVTAVNQPKLYVFNTCMNVHRAFTGYSYKTRPGEGMGLSDKIEDTWECPMACVGYFCVAHDPWTKNNGSKGNAESSFLDEIMRGRDANYHDPHEISFVGDYNGERVA